jgi:hypothetical protein
MLIDDACGNVIDCLRLTEPFEEGMCCGNGKTWRYQVQVLSLCNGREYSHKPGAVNNSHICVTSGFRRELNETCAVLGYYAASSGNYRRFGTNCLPRNVGKEIPPDAA